MNSRILSFVGITGMLLATGCGGGSGSGGVSPTSSLPTVGGGTGVGASSKGRSLSISFRSPIATEVVGTSSKTRSPQYVSPGTASTSIYLSSAHAVTTAGALGGGVAPSFTSTSAILTNFTPAGKLTGTLPLSGTAITNLTGSSTATATYSIVLSGSYSTTTITIPGVTGSASSTDTQFVRVGAVLTDASGFVLSEGEVGGATENGVTPTAANGTSPDGFNITTVADTPFIPVLNNGPTTVIVPLNPVPATVYIFGSTGVEDGLGNPVTPSQAVTGAASGSYEFTAYVADHAGYVIPAQDASTLGNVVNGWTIADFVVPFDGQATYTLTSSSVLLTPTASNFNNIALVKGGVSGGASLIGPSAALATIGGPPITTVPTNLDPIPTALQATLGLVAAQHNPGYLVGGVSLAGGSVGYGSYSAGYAFNSGVATYQATVGSTTSANLYFVVTNPGFIGGLPQAGYGVTGFSYTGSNYPSSGYLSKVGGAGIDQVNVPLTPSVVPIIQ